MLLAALLKAKKMKKSLSIALFPLVLASCNANNSLDIPFTKDGIEIINDNYFEGYSMGGVGIQSKKDTKALLMMKF